MKRTVITAYFDHRHRRLKVPNASGSVNPNAAVMRCHWNLVAGVYRNARYAEVYDIETAELFAQFRVTLRKGEDVVETVYKANPRTYKDPIRRTSAHALFHDLELETAQSMEEPQ
jgi:hypothetical protein